MPVIRSNGCKKKNASTLRQCMVMSMSVQVAHSYAQLSFVSPDRGMQGVLQIEPPANMIFDSEILDPNRLLEAIAPCGSFKAVPSSRLWQGLPLMANMQQVNGLPMPYVVQLSEANSSTIACVRSACWDATRYATNDVGPHHHSALIGLGLLAVASLFALHLV